MRRAVRLCTNQCAPRHLADTAAQDCRDAARDACSVKPRGGDYFFRVTLVSMNREAAASARRLRRQELRLVCRKSRNYFHPNTKHKSSYTRIQL